MTPRLKSDLWVSALIRRAQGLGAFATVLRKGDDQAGIVLIIIRRGSDLAYYTPERNLSGERVWWKNTMTNQTELDERLNRRVDEDPDIWIVEIESDKSAEMLIGESVTDGAPSDGDSAKAAAQALFRGR